MLRSVAEAFSPARRGDAFRREFWACLALIHCRGLGVRGANALLQRFGTAYAAVQAVDAWGEADVSPRCAAYLRGNGWRDKARAEWDAARHSSAGVVLWSEPDYPAWLRTIPDAPARLYFLGDPALFRTVAVAVVGRRECSVEGLRATVLIARGIAGAGVTIVSGMARGVDRAAHLAGLEGPGGSIGVLGTGIDGVYPKSNADLFSLMGEKGLLVSEYPPGFVGSGRFFPLRNRIISGLAKAVVVTEAAVRSGSLNTARHALEQNRELMAVPGPVTAESAKGCQELIRRGAKPVFSADDVLSELLPYLAAHVREALEKRDCARFVPQAKAAGRDVPALPPEGAGQGGLVPGLLPWLVSAADGDDVPKALPGKKRFGGKSKTPDAAGGKKAAVPESVPVSALSGAEADVYALLRQGPRHIDDICRYLGQNIALTSGTLTMLEVKGYATRLPGMMYTAATGSLHAERK